MNWIIERGVTLSLSHQIASQKTKVKVRPKKVMPTSIAEYCACGCDNTHLGECFSCKERERSISYEDRATRRDRGLVLDSILLKSQLNRSTISLYSKMTGDNNGDNSIFIKYTSIKSHKVLYCVIFDNRITLTCLRSSLR